jgi:NAD(P)-dependent dehydrogenase (short-subunit alcohol dehydrogenase family)
LDARLTGTIAIFLANARLIAIYENACNRHTTGHSIVLKAKGIFMIDSVSRRLEGKIAIVTGASRGIGAASARHFALEGATVILASRTEGAVQAVAHDIGAAGGQALAVPTDVGDPAAVERLIKQTLDTYGRLDIAFNNAGTSHPPKPLTDLAIADFESVIRDNLTGTFLAMKYEIPAMIASGGGAIVNMASTAGLQGVQGLADYVAAKHGIIGLTKSAALDYASRNVRVNVIAPGPILNERIAAAGDQAREQIGRAVPMRRIGQPEEIAATVAWLCSSEAAFITGAVLSIDGGRLAGSMTG